MPTPRVLLLIPPLTQLNTPYPSTAYLTGFLQAHDVPCEQRDLGIEMVLRLFSRAGLELVFDEVRRAEKGLPAEARAMLRAERSYVEMIDLVVEFLQGRNPGCAKTLATPGGLPRGPRFRGRTRFRRSVSLQDRAKQCATFFLEDLSDLIQAVVSPHFGLSRYADHLASSASSFDGLRDALAQPLTLPDHVLVEQLRRHIDSVRPQLVGLSVPFPGNLYGAFRIAQELRSYAPEVKVALGGGYVNTELRRVADPRVFDYVDYITLDDGERPLLSLVQHLAGQRSHESLCRTFYRCDGRVRFADAPAAESFSVDGVGCPTYRGLRLDRYLTILDSTNPMHRLWSEGHWNKVTVAHGCYWKQCTFCDVGLEYIGRYEMTPTDRLIRQIEQLIGETGHRNFHFVDEAAPPAGLKALALGLLERGIKIRWWGNIRFEEAFTPDLCRLLSAAGCIAVTAGLEAASDRLLEKMKKGITVDQTAMVAASFREAGILVHAYLMYGFPSETIQETVDSLERVRQLFAADLLQSGFWHRFTATAHSPIGLHPAAHGIRVLGPKFQGFAENDLRHRDPRGRTPEWLAEGLRRSMLNFIEGRGLTMDVRRWFDHPALPPRVSHSWVDGLLHARRSIDDPSKERRLVWMGEHVEQEASGRSVRFAVFAKRRRRSVTLPKAEALWFVDVLRRATPAGKSTNKYPRIREIAGDFPGGEKHFAAFIGSSAWRTVRDAGLLLV
ncbi:MAG TPA: radical SAM protein [Nitrospira sp.]|nr:radical SAM protein [Nitrospira sp.]